MQEQGMQEQGIQEQGAKNEFEVTPAESGQKLLQFLQRRLALPPTLLHRWVRTGQIRRNGGRCKPFDHVDAGDMVRLPPFALAMNQSALEDNALRVQRTEDAENAPRASHHNRQDVRQGQARDGHDSQDVRGDEPVRQGHVREDGHPRQDVRQGHVREDGHPRQGHTTPHQDRQNRPAPRVGQPQAGTTLPPPYRQLQRSITPPQLEDSPQSRRVSPEQSEINPQCVNSPKQRKVNPQCVNSPKQREENPQAKSAATPLQPRALGQGTAGQLAPRTAHSLALQDAPHSAPQHASSPEQPSSPSQPSSPAQPPSPHLLHIVHTDECLLVINKPAGLPVHPGTGHSDSLTTRLAQYFTHAPFHPTPAHRLDKDTSGLLLVASTYSTLRALQEAFLHRHMIKEYVAWVQGIWTEDTPVMLRHHLAKQYVGKDEKMRVVSAAIFSNTNSDADSNTGKGTDTEAHKGFDTHAAPANAQVPSPTSLPTQGKEALCVAHCLRREPAPLTTLARQTDKQANKQASKQAQAPTLAGRSLMHIRLITGRTHQIRAQLAAVGHPLCGDFKYGAATLLNAEKTTNARYAANTRRTTPPHHHHHDRALYLHSLRIILPDVPELTQVPHEFAVLPPWQGVLALQELPPPLTVPAP